MPARSVNASVAAISVALLGAAVLVVAPQAGAVQTSSEVVISEVYGGGGNGGAPFSNDFVELVNHGTAPVSVAGWSVQYASATGTSWTNTTTLTGSIAAGGFYLVAEGAGGTPSAVLPTPDATGTIAMAAGAGKVALVNDDTALACGATCSTAADVVDFVGYGAASDSAGGHPAPVLGNATSDQRTLTPYRNTGDNAADFTAGAPTPTSSTGNCRRRRYGHWHRLLGDTAARRVRAGHPDHSGRPGRRFHLAAEG
jgi:predicted extracellular nuclease